VEALASLLPILGIFLIFWLLIIRPAQRRQKKLQGVQRELAVGDRVITGAGFFGTVVRVDDDRLGLEIAEGVVMTVARQAVVGTVDDDLAATAPSPADASANPSSAAEPSVPEASVPEATTTVDPEAPSTHKEQ
jgi:preprotein translocase subunit YajC